MKGDLNDDGQVSVDFLTGISVFLFSLIFMLSFITSTVAPFTSSGGNVNSAGAERASERLYTDLLTSEDKPIGVLNETVTRDYFDSNDADQIKEDLGVSDVRRINITITNSTSGDIYSIGGVDLTAGDPVPDTGVFDSASRVRVAYMKGTVEPDNETVELNVRVR